jgi:hypothetical protein
VVLWTIRRPTRGWYIRLCAPSFPPGSFIPLLPVAKEAQHYSPAALSFNCRVNIPSIIPRKSRTLSMETDSTLNDDSGIHSYPPTPPAVIVVQPPSPSVVHAKLNEIAPRPSLHQTQIIEFYLIPLSVINQRQISRGSFFSRALSVFTSNSWPDSNSFGLYPVKSISLPAYPLPVGTQTSVLPTHQASSSPGSSTEPIPLLTFHDRTSVLTAGSITGLIEIDQTIERLLGVQTSFWIAIALTYLGNLEEREVRKPFESRFWTRRSNFFLTELFGCQQRLRED